MGLKKQLPIFINGVMRAAGPVLVGTCWFLIGFVVYAYFLHILPMMQLELTSAKGGGVTMIGIWILFNLMYNHVMAVFTSPGHPTALFTSPGHPTARPVGSEDALLEEGQASKRIRFCRKCSVPKPERTHHCSVCNKCVLKMDHHCPWIANCVGYRNCRFFYLFLLYLWVGCFFVCCVGTPLVWQRSSITHEDRKKHMPACLLALCLCLSALIALCLMLLLHSYLIVTNQTTIELHGNRTDRRQAQKRGEKWKNPYSKGRQRNLEEVFGVSRSRLLWLVPMAPNLAYDGAHF